MDTVNRSVVGAVAIGALLFVLQHALFVNFTVLGVHPELLLLFAVCCGLAGGPNYGVVAGFIAGLVSDAFLTSPLGLSAFAFAVAGYLAGIASNDTTPVAPMTMLNGAGATAVGLVIVLILGGLTGDLRVSFGHALAVIFVASFVNGLLSPFCRRALKATGKRNQELAW